MPQLLRLSCRRKIEMNTRVTSDFVVNPTAIAGALLARSFAQLLATVAAAPGVDVTPAFSASMTPPKRGYYFCQYQGSDARVRRYWDGVQWHFRGDLNGMMPCGFGEMPGDEWRGVYTPWFDAGVAPAYVGDYVREYPDAMCRDEPDYWDGQRWIVDGEVGAACFRWRGITSLDVPAGH
jgi:hypothetical protein